MRERSDDQTAGRWLAVAVGSLLLAGGMALALVIARVPPLSTWVTNPEVFKRALVVHVDLSIVVWFYAFLGGLFALLPARPGGWRVSALGPGVALGGIVAMVGSLFFPGVQPVLSNYVPALDHPAFLMGVFAFFLGVALTFADRRLLPWHEPVVSTSLVPDVARPGLRAAALAYLLAMLTIVASAITMPESLPAQGKYELLFWGGGHVLQVASEAAMLSVWLMLLTPALGKAPLSRPLATALFGLLLVPPMAAPLLALQGVSKGEVHDAFTLGMRWGVFPVVLVFLGACLVALRRAVREGRARLSDPRVLGFLTSAALTLAGFVLGALIRGSNTMVPAHYHANIGAVTASFMAATFPLLAGLGAPRPSERLARFSRFQPVLFGLGQLVFALGFALAGAEGMARKTYGAEQHVRTAQEWAGLVVMGTGGLVAIAGGVLFLTVVLGTVFRRAQSPVDPRSTTAWPPGASIPSRS